MAEKTEKQSLQQLKRDIADDTLKNIYIFHGEETYLREYYLSAILKKLVPHGLEEFNFHRVEGKDLRVETLTELVEAMPMMAEHTLVQVTDFDPFKLDEGQRKSLIALLEDFPPYCCLILVYDRAEYKPNRTMKGLCKALSTYAEVVKFETQSRGDLLNWIARRFRANGKTLDAQTAEHLIFTCGSLMNGLIPEIEKISAYTRGGVVTIRDIDAVAAPILEAQVFDMTNAISQGNYDRAAELLSTLLKMQEDGYKLLAVMGKELRKLYTARLAIDGGMDRFWLMEQWGLRSDYPAKLLMNAARKVTTAWAAEAVRRCQALDLRMKSVTGADGEEELKLFLMELAQGVKR